MGGAGWARGEARVADDSDFQTLKSLLESKDGWNLEYEKDGVKVWTENAAHGALRTVKVCFVLILIIYASLSSLKDYMVVAVGNLMSHYINGL